MTTQDRRTPKMSRWIIALAAVLPASAGLAAAETAPAQSDKPITHATESLQSCMEKWDPGTHMTKEAWRETCLRIKRERSRYPKEH